MGFCGGGNDDDNDVIARPATRGAPSGNEVQRRSAAMRTDPTLLTKRQLEFLANANDCTPPSERAVRFGWSGIGAKGAQLRTVDVLTKKGLLEFVEYGRMEDDDNGDPERPIYAITAAGRAFLAVVTAETSPARRGST